MLKKVCEFIDELGNVDDGVESILSEKAFNALCSLITDIYGKRAGTAFTNLFVKRDNGSMVMIVEEGSDVFLSSLKANNSFSNLIQEN